MSAKLKKTVPALSIVAVLVVGCVAWISNQQAQQQTAQHIPTTQAASKSQIADRLFIYAGLPKGQQVTLLKKNGFWVGYSEKHKDPLWVSYRIFKMQPLVKPPRPKVKFATDIDTEARVKHIDYNNSGYERGHMAPSQGIGICYGEDGQLGTFIMSNICPQTKSLNNGPWKRLEATEVEDYAQRFEEVWVIDGPIFKDKPETIGPGIDVPIAFYKIVVDEENGQPRMLAFVMPQDVTGKEPVQTFLASVRQIEKETGLDFFSDLEDGLEERLETAVPKEMW